MGAVATAVRIRHDLQARLLEARTRTDEIFRVVRDDAMYDRPIAERHRIIFYVGHVEAFDWNLLSHRAFGLRSFHTAFDQLFAFGIDPVGGGLPADTPADWPTRDEVERYKRRVRDELDRAIEHALLRPEEGHPHLMTMLEVAIEHRLMHAETLAYMLHRLPAEKKIRMPEKIAWKASRVKSHLVEIPAGRTTLGMEKSNGDEFGWDNEFSAHDVDVPAFAIENHNVSNHDFLRFIQAGGYENHALWSPAAWAWIKKEGIEHPMFWRRDGNLWVYRTMFGEIRLPQEWPVYVSLAEATAYANWLGRKLPTEAQFHRAAYGTPNGDAERVYPWGNEAPSERHGNFDFRTWDPSPVGAHPAGASAFGVHDLVGNGWEWTHTEFSAFPGFTPMPFYPGYSANFFDGKHYVMKGGSPRTAACMLRRSFRNWFQPHYPHVYATFRCVEE
ncbi:MAG TPA: SUMF1/EgtB/PvdO family nonheme iron enzyme [Methylomirabilota bacterium]|nr:SUMF1/EgtB/PvdO family nonheme iron enzyme [Methylomirabilota bacterium]